jgi:hypothetical protein
MRLFSIISCIKKSNLSRSLGRTYLSSLAAFLCAILAQSLSMHKNDKQKSTESETDLNTNEKPKEEWLDAESTKGSEPGSSPGSDETPREVWIDEKDKKKK